MSLTPLPKYTSLKELSKNNTKAVICERGARLIYLSVNNSPNLLWVNPQLDKILEKNEWNTGGLRVWISPERNFFYRKPATFQEWFCPNTLDPANYKILEARENKIVLQTDFELKDIATGETLRGVIRREFLLREAAENRATIAVREALFTEKTISTKVNLWALLQVNPPGTVVVPVKENAEPVHYFKPIPLNRIKVSNEAVFFKIDGNLVCKLGVKPEDLPTPGEACIAYISNIGNIWYYLMLKTSQAPENQEECLDPPKHNPEGPRGCVQSYNSGPEGGPEKFGEIELQFEPATKIGKHYISTVKYTLEAAVGTREEVLRSLKETLNLKEIVLL